MPTRRFKAPAGDREVLADPPAEDVPALVDANRAKLDRDDVKVGGLPLRDLRALARREALEAALKYTESPPPYGGGLSPLLLAGHQPELSHPGVWVKHFALNGLAKRVGGVALNLVVDNDTLKTTSLRFPFFRDRDPQSVRLESVAFDRFDREEPYEDRGVHDPQLFRSFAGRTAPLWKNWGFTPVLAAVWRDLLAYPESKSVEGAWDDGRRPMTISERFAHVRRTWERKWGCNNLELTVSQLANTTAFARFSGHLIGDLPRFRRAYNTALKSYRHENQIRSANHPASDLVQSGEWCEAPFWVWRFQPQRRRRLLVSHSHAGVRLRLEGDGACELDHPGDEAGWLRTWQFLADLGYRIRPRALTLTLFARVCLGDFFVHGIGGGKYDEVTDAIIRDYFGLDPPAYQVLSATLRLPLPAFPTTAGDVQALERRERDMYWNPQRHLPRPEVERPDVRDLLHKHDGLAAVEPPDRAGRRRRFRELRAVGDHLRPLVAPRMAEAHAWITRARQETAANGVLMRRDFAWVLYPEDVLRPFVQGFL